MSTNLEEIVEQLSNLSVLDMSKLKAMLEEKWGVKAAAAQAVVSAAPAVSEGAKESESTEFKVSLKEAPADKKIAIIKVVREITGLGLKEAKELVEAAPKVLKDSVPKSQAEEILKKIEAAGGKATSEGL